MHSIFEEDTVVTKAKESAKVSHLPEHGPIDENGREVLLSLKNVDITFGKGDSAVRAVKNASFDIYKGETFSLVGESGSGKTTIGRAVIRVNPCAAGEIQYKGVRISGKTTRSLDREVIRNIQMVFQDPAASPTSAPPWTISSPRACTTSTSSRARRSAWSRWRRSSKRWACSPSI